MSSSKLKPRVPSTAVTEHGIQETESGSAGLPLCTDTVAQLPLPDRAFHASGVSVLVTSVSPGPRAVPGTQQGAQQVLVEQMSGHEASGGTGTFPDSLLSDRASSGGVTAAGSPHAHMLARQGHQACRPHPSP